jgi:type II secretory pathway component PulJ
VTLRRRNLQRQLGANRRPVLRRAMTLLEVVLAVLMLGMVAASVSSALAFTLNSDSRAQVRLSAYEVANRVVLQYLDDRTALPNPAAPIEYGRYRFFWEAVPINVEMRVKAADASSGRSAPRNTNRFEFVTVRVWLAVGTTGRGGSLQKGELLAELDRLLDPTAPRNPDAARRMATPNGIIDLMKRMGIDSSGDAGHSGGTPGGRTPGSGTPRTPGTSRPGSSGSSTRPGVR